MVGVTAVKIEESLDSLKEKLKEEKEGINKEKIQMLYWLKQEKPLKLIKIAEALGRHRTTVQRWATDYKKGGLKQLITEKAKIPGRPRKIPKWAEEALGKRLKEPENGFKSYIEIQQWLGQELGIEAEYAAVHHMVRYRLKAKLKVVRPQNIKQDKNKREAFKKTLARL
jgi:transposase